MIVIPTYRGFRVEVNAVAVDGRYNSEVRIFRLFARDKPHVTAEHAEWAGEQWARRWIGAKEGRECP